MTPKEYWQKVIDEFRFVERAKRFDDFAQMTIWN